MKRSKYYDRMCDIVDATFPKGKCRERGNALVMLAFIEMMLQGKEIKFCESGHIIAGTGGNTCPECGEKWRK